MVAIPAAAAGCHLLLEKPISHSLDGLAELQGRLQAAEARCWSASSFAFTPGCRKLAAAARAGRHRARPLSARAHWGEYLPGWHPWEDYRQGYSARADLGGGVILTLCHPLDYLRWLLGEVEALWAFAGRLSDLELDVEDTAEIGLHFAGDSGSVHLDYNQRPPLHSLEIIGAQGTLRWDNADGAISVFESQSGGAGAWRTYPIQETFGRGESLRAQRFIPG